MLQCQCLITRENRQNGNKEGSQKSTSEEGTSEEGSKEEVTSTKAKQNGGRDERPPFCVYGSCIFYCVTEGFGAFFGVDRYPDTLFFSITFTTSSYSIGSLPV